MNKYLLSLGAIAFATWTFLGGGIGISTAQEKAVKLPAPVSAQPTYPQSGQPGLARTVPPLDGLAYTAPHSRHSTLSIEVNLGPSPDSGLTCKKTPLFPETCVALVAEWTTGAPSGRFSSPRS
jgi:hypothetical protein